MRNAMGTLCVGLALMSIQSMTEAGETKSPKAVIEMDAGKVVIEFYEKDAPETVANFVKLAKKGFYDGLRFHRVVPGFVVQGGVRRVTGPEDLATPSRTSSTRASI